MSTARIAADRLYALDIRPQELAVYGERVRFELRYAPIFDDPAEVAEKHYKLLVLEILAPLTDEDALARGGQRELHLLKIGWELELTAPAPCRVGTLDELEAEVPLLLGRVADTVNELARRAKLEAPMGPELVRTLIADYRARGRSG